MENDLEVTDEEEREGSDGACHVYGCLVSSQPRFPLPQLNSVCSSGATAIMKSVYMPQMGNEDFSCKSSSLLLRNSSTQPTLINLRYWSATHPLGSSRAQRLHLSSIDSLSPSLAPRCFRKPFPVF
jgi:hypothetical protein